MKRRLKLQNMRFINVSLSGRTGEQPKEKSSIEYSGFGSNDTFLQRSRLARHDGRFMAETKKKQNKLTFHPFHSPFEVKIQMEL